MDTLKKKRTKESDVNTLKKKKKKKNEIARNVSTSAQKYEWTIEQLLWMRNWWYIWKWHRKEPTVSLMALAQPGPNIHKLVTFLCMKEYTRLLFFICTRPHATTYRYKHQTHTKSENPFCFNRTTQEHCCIFMILFYKQSVFDKNNNYYLVLNQNVHLSWCHTGSYIFWIVEQIPL